MGRWKCSFRREIANLFAVTAHWISTHSLATQSLSAHWISAHWIVLNQSPPLPLLPINKPVPLFLEVNLPLHWVPRQTRAIHRHR